jgi:hypothetical protein
MIRYLAKYFADVSPAFIDGLTYVLLAFVTAVVATLSSDEAAKYIRHDVLFVIKSFFQANGAALLALKMFRSTSFAEHQQKKKDATAFFRKETP